MHACMDLDDGVNRARRCAPIGPCGLSRDVGDRWLDDDGGDGFSDCEDLGFWFLDW